MAVKPFACSLEHVLAELARLDLLIQAEVRHTRAVQSGYGELQGICISEQEIDQLLQSPTYSPGTVAGRPSGDQDLRLLATDLETQLAARRAETEKQGLVLRLDRITRLFHLGKFEVDALLLCLAPELDLRYERLFGYLQDDVEKKRPTVDLILKLLCPSPESQECQCDTHPCPGTLPIAFREYFLPSAPLLGRQLLSVLDDTGRPQAPLLAKSLKVDDRIVNYLLDSNELPSLLRSCLTPVTPQIQLQDLLLPDEQKRALHRAVQDQPANLDRVLLYFQGPYGVGKRSAAEALCRESGLRLLVLDGQMLQLLDDATVEMMVRLAEREAQLQNAALYWEHFDLMLAEDKRGQLARCLRELPTDPGLTFLAGQSLWEPVDAPPNLRWLRFEFSRPTQVEQLQLWRRSLDGNLVRDAESELDQVASKFRFSGGQIRDAVATARNIARGHHPENAQVTLDDLYTACHLQSNRNLATLAHRIIPHYQWEDIVLPPDRIQQLLEVSNYVKYHALVYDQWGFDRKLALGKGLNILFAGPSGTGKTMAADIMAGELRLDLYRIDLSTVVSKYIGETEKNLAHIFAEAETSNAILFFDEADALFGKRSEVRDSHDRYANIEISYLLQKMEEYDGVAILATNLRRNMDDAFVRRMHFAVEFPLPDAGDRRRIWEQIWPESTPRGADLDLDFMARRFELAGGNIRNIALAAAFFAAGDSAVVHMAHLIRATRREYQKMGKVVLDGEFGEYAELVPGAMPGA